MKRDIDFEDDLHQIGPNKTLRINHENTLSPNINNHNATFPTNFSTNTNPSNVASSNKGTNLDDDDNNSNNNNNKEHDRFLPIANVGRIMKKIIPGNGKISKDAKETVQECVSEFISFVTGEASEKCQREKRKTINGDDILWAIMTLGFEDYVSPLKVYLTRYREVEGEKLNVPKQQRVEQPLQHQQKADESYNNVYSSTNMIPQPSFVSSDPSSFPLSTFSQNSVQTTISPQQNHFDGSW